MKQHSASSKQAPAIGVRRGGKYANGMVPEPSVMGFVKDRMQAVRGAFSPSQTAQVPPIAAVLQPAVDIVTTNTGLTGGAVSAAEQRNAANRSALELANGAVAIKGAGTSKSDSIHGVSLSKGESVLPAATTRALGARNIARVIEATNGRPPAVGARVGGKHADGAVPTPEEIQAAADRKALQENIITPVAGGVQKFGAAAKDIATLPGRAAFGAVNTVLRLPNAFGADIPYIPESVFGGDSGSMTPNMDRIRANEQPPVPTTMAQSPAPITSAAGLPPTSNPVTGPSIGARQPVSTAAPVPEYQPEDRTNVMSAEAFGALDPRISRQLSEARQAAAARGDWDAVNASYGVNKPERTTAPDFSQYPNTIEGVLARKAAMQNFVMSQRAAGQQAENEFRRQGLDIRRQEAVAQGQLANAQLDLSGLQGADLRQKLAQQKQIQDIQTELGTAGVTETRAKQLTERLHMLQGTKPDTTAQNQRIEAAKAIVANPLVAPEDAATANAYLRSVFGGAPTQGVTRAQVDAAAKAKGITDPSKLNDLYKTYGV